MIGFVFLACLSFPVKLPQLAGERTEMSRMLAVDFEVFGIVQGNFISDSNSRRLLTLRMIVLVEGVFFRKVSKASSTGTRVRPETRDLTLGRRNACAIDLERPGPVPILLTTRDISRHLLQMCKCTFFLPIIDYPFTILRVTLVTRVTKSS